MEIQQITSEEKLYKAAVELRHRLFFSEFGLPIEVTCDQLEETSTHYAITKDSKLIAYARLSELKKGEFKISQVVVEPEHQGKGLGTGIISHVIEAARSVGAGQLELNAQVSASELYKKFGFKAAGDVRIVELTGIPHIRMVLDL